MTHEEIIFWIQENLISLLQRIDKKYVITYVTVQGSVEEKVCDHLIAGVMEINS